MWQRSDLNRFFSLQWCDQQHRSVFSPSESSRHTITEDINETDAVWEWQDCHSRVPGSATAVLQSFVWQAFQAGLPALGTCKLHLQVHLQTIAHSSWPFPTLWFSHTASRRRLLQMKYGVKVRGVSAGQRQMFLPCYATIERIRTLFSSSLLKVCSCLS